ncbi:family 20 glycosylhydrolase [Paraoerskovia marina]|uniref:family 20 glycosylhydrolase n=1 Tax=Paraoerskovia marina TaxID=545619 RepID=UPI0005BBF49E|nr:family 20 glycosylhydrolase [Paraoerskovia marina]
MFSLIPQPLSLQAGDGAPFALAGAVIRGGATEPEQRLARRAAQTLTRAAGVAVSTGSTSVSTGSTSVSTGSTSVSAGSTIELRLDLALATDRPTSDDRYVVEVTADGIVARAAAVPGLHLAVATIAQLVRPASGETPAHVPAVVVEDEPRYAWRGLSVDIARNFFGPESLQRVLDLASSYKLNRLHLHLTDDQGWRIDTPSRPLLTDISSKTAMNGNPGGFLTLDEYEELQVYAEDRGIVIVPEIDVPGHVNAATHAYGELMPDGRATDAYEGMEVGFSKLSIDLPATEPFLRDVFGDLAAATHGDYLHIGGDEVKQMQDGEFGRFVDLLERVVLDTGKKVAAWHEAAHAQVRPETLVQFWDTNHVQLEPLQRAAANGTRFIMSPGNHVYLDMKYTADYALGQDWAGLVELSDAYVWNPDEAVEGISGDSIVGVEAAVWTETLTTLDELNDMLMPRLPAVAEVAWTPQDAKDWGGFRERLVRHIPGWERDGVAFHRTPQVTWE